MKKLFLIFILTAVLLFASACQPQPEATDPAPVEELDPACDGTQTTHPDVPADTDTTQPSEITESAETDSENPAVNLLFEAYAFTDSLENREIQTMVYTRQGSSSQSINLRIIMRGMHSGTPAISAAGNVKAKDLLIPLEMYYSESVLYSSASDSKNRQDIDFETAACSIDVLRQFKKSVLAENIIQAQAETGYDGKTVLTVTFSQVNTGETFADGTGEIIIDSAGYISSETYNLESKDQKGNTVRQSVESSLISFGDDVPAIVFPDFGEY